MIIGILAAIAIPKFASTKEKAYLASHEVATCATGPRPQEGYFADNTAYLAGVASNVAGAPVPLVGPGDFMPSSGVTVTFAQLRHRLERRGDPQRDDPQLRDLRRRRGPQTVGGINVTSEGEPKCN